MLSRWKKSLIFIGITLLVFSVYRLALYLSYPEAFASLSTATSCSAFLQGIRFDLSIIFTFFALPLLMMNLPLRHAKHKVWFGFWGMILYLFVVIATLLLVGDFIYFDAVKRHMGRELMALSEDKGYLLDMVKGGYMLHLAAFFIFALVLLFFWVKVLIVDKAPLSRPLLKFVVLVLLLFLGIRGTIDRKSITVIDAFQTGNAAYGNLCLNGIFTTYHAMRKSKVIDHHHMSDEEAYGHLGLPKKEYPFSKSYDGKPTGYNVVYILMESWGFKYVDSFGGNSYGVTPNFDALAREGVKFVNFYAAGQRSVDGIQATLTGLPLIQGLPRLGSGLEVSNFTGMGEVARKNGYRTLFMQSSNRRSFRVDAIASATGFDEYFGKEDMPILLDYADPEGSKFGWDYESYMLLKEKLSGETRPFVAYLFTGSTHTPYADFGKKFEKYPHERMKENGFLNSLAYSDWSLGEFMKEARKEPWFDKTVFILSADHASDYEQNHPIEKFHIPLVIYAPKIFRSKTVTTIASQLDMMPTVIDILGFNDEFSAMGDSIFRKKESYALVTAGEVAGVVTDRGFLSHSLKNRLHVEDFDAPLPEAYLDSLEKKLLAIDQLSFQLVEANRWAR